MHYLIVTEETSRPYGLSLVFYVMDYFFSLFEQTETSNAVIRYFLVISIPAETPFFSFIDHVI